MRPMKIWNYLLLGLFVLTILVSCQKEQYRKDRRNRLTKHAKKSSDYLANQSIELTQNNIAKRDVTDKKARKRLEKHQEELNEANQRTSKVKPAKKHRGNFKFY